MTAMTYIQPLLFIFLIAASIGLMRPRQGKRSVLANLGVLGILLLSWPPVDWLLSKTLEARYPIQPFPSAPAQAIVVLSSAANPAIYQRPYPLPDKETYQRCDFAAWLYKNWQPLPILVAGGKGAKGNQAVSVTMRQLLQRDRVPESMIWTEEGSSSTHENAVFGAKILRQHGISRIALVVEARSMPRAAACFRKEGITVIPAPCEFREFESLGEFIPSWKAIKRNEETLHETVGLAWYWLRGWI
jgi:uncharacterized SAM-binding protein YcdF (DUF218 family)